MFPNLIDKRVFIDTETTGLSWWCDELFGISIKVDGKLYYYDVRYDAGVIKWLSIELPQAEHVIAHNAKFDYHFLREAGIPMDSVKKVTCTMINAALINEHELAYDLDSLCAKYLKRKKDSTVYQMLADMFGGPPTRKAQMTNLYRAPKEKVTQYATTDVDLCAELYDYQMKEIEAQDLFKVVGLEQRLLPVLCRMEERGVRIDVDRAEKTYHDLDRIAKELQHKINQQAGRPLNVNSSKQLAELFRPERVDGRWILDGAIYIPATETGAPSLTADVLRTIPRPIAGDILELRRTIKTRDTFIKGHILGHQIDGIIHANINQTKGDNELGTGTGRLSYNAPALQQIHKRNKKIASIVRSIFIPYERQKWLSGDWDQKEFRWFAHYARNPQILKMYQDNPDTDFHQAVAELTGLPRSPTDGIKGNAKQINLGLVFGMGMGKLAQEMGLPYTLERRDGREFLIPGIEAQHIFEQYHENVPGVRDMLQKAATVAKNRGFVETVMGRHIRFPGGKFTHKAAGLIFQGSAADSMKEKLVELDKEFSNTDVNLLLSVHDETDFSIDEGDTKSQSRIKEILELFDGDRCPISCRVPIRATVTIADNWWEASK